MRSVLLELPPRSREPNRSPTCALRPPTPATSALLRSVDGSYSSALGIRTSTVAHHHAPDGVARIHTAAANHAIRSRTGHAPVPAPSAGDAGAPLHLMGNGVLQAHFAPAGPVCR